MKAISQRYYDVEVMIKDKIDNGGNFDSRHLVTMKIIFFTKYFFKISPLPIIKIFLRENPLKAAD